MDFKTFKEYLIFFENKTMGEVIKEHKNYLITLSQIKRKLKKNVITD